MFARRELWLGSVCVAVGCLMKVVCIKYGRQKSEQGRESTVTEKDRAMTQTRSFLENTTKNVKKVSALRSRSSIISCHCRKKKTARTPTPSLPNEETRVTTEVRIHMYTSSYNNTCSDPKSLYSPIQNPCHFSVIISHKTFPCLISVSFYV